MEHSRITAGSLAGIAALLAGTLLAQGADVPFTERVISTTADFTRSVFAKDVDGDGDIDVLSASALDNKIAWYENDGGSPPTFSERVISTGAAGAHSVFATDVDGDGDIDVLSASRDDNKISWYESDGGLPPTFTERVISTNANAAVSVFATDMDGDGDTDVLSASSDDNKIAWYEAAAFDTEVKITASDGQPDDNFGFALSIDGDTAIVGAACRCGRPTSTLLVCSALISSPYVAKRFGRSRDYLLGEVRGRAAVVLVPRDLVVTR